MTINTLTVASVQMVSTDQPAQNLASMQHWVAEAAACGAQLVVLPEYWAIMGLGDSDKVALREPYGSSPLQSALAQLAQQHGIWLVGGTLPLDAGVDGKIYNSSLVFDPNGVCVARYDKIHLFSFSGHNERYCESDTIVAGTTPTVVDTPFGLLGLSVCYDLRFPELYRSMPPLNMIALPAAFTATTGAAHWEVLLRARAIENQCYVIAAAQGGTHPSGRKTYGHSMIIDPWGTILDELPSGVGVVTTHLNFNHLQTVRSNLPALAHRVL